MSLITQTSPNASPSIPIPPFQLTQPLPSSELLHFIKETSTIAKQNQYLVSFDSKEIIINDNNIKFPSRLSTNLLKKPTPNLTHPSNSFRDPFMAPFPIGAHICDLNTNYRLLLNKYNVVPNHVLIITKEFIQQTSPLISDDFDVTYSVISSMNGLAFYNSGVYSGASQPHKHFQIIPRNKLFPIQILTKNIINNNSNDQKDDDNTIKLYTLKQYKFIHYLYLIDDKDCNKLHKAYCKMIEKIKNDIRLYHANDIGYLNVDKFSYNLLMTTDYMMIVSRKYAKYLNEKEYGVDVNINVNSLGFAGTFFCKTKESLKMLQEIGPLTVLKNVSFSIN